MPNRYTTDVDALSSHELDDTPRDLARRVGDEVKARGIRGAAAQLRSHRQTLFRCAAGLKVRRSTIAALTLRFAEIDAAQA